MGNMEVAYELQAAASIMVASEQVEPFEGWNYYSILTLPDELLEDVLILLSLHLRNYLVFLFPQGNLGYFGIS